MLAVTSGSWWPNGRTNWRNVNACSELLVFKMEARYWGSGDLRNPWFQWWLKIINMACTYSLTLLVGVIWNSLTLRLLAMLTKCFSQHNKSTWRDTIIILQTGKSCLSSPWNPELSSNNPSSSVCHTWQMFHGSNVRRPHSVMTYNSCIRWWMCPHTVFLVSWE